MQDGRYFAVKLPAGKYAIRSEDKGVGITLNTEDGKEYFVRIEMALGGFKSTQQVTEVSRKQWESELPGLKPLDAKNVIDNKLVFIK